MEKYKDFVELVRRMREAQRSYFRDKTPALLKESKIRERDVDQSVRELQGFTFNEEKPHQ